MVLADELFRMRASQWSPDRQGLDVRGKKALIFGGSKGIGSAIQNILLESGCTVRLATRTTGCDIRNLNQVHDAISLATRELDGLDFVVNTAGFLSKESLHEQDGETIDELISVNLTGVIYISKWEPTLRKRLK